jgi:hypothetical protein
MKDETYVVYNKLKGSLNRKISMVLQVQPQTSIQMQRVRHDNVTDDIQTQNTHNTRTRMGTHNAKPREREKVKTISRRGQIMTKGIERLGTEAGTRTPRDRRCPRQLASPI